MTSGEYKARILRFLSTGQTPWDVEKVRAATGIGNWNTCLKHLLELLIDGKISGQKTSKSWVFWVEESSLE
jgi:hypothetical protein